MRPISPFFLAPLLLGGCVSSVDIFQVEVTLSVPCESWAEAGAPTGPEDLYSLDFFRSTSSGSNGSGCAAVQTLCYNQLPLAAQRLACGETRTLIMDVGDFPEVMGARVTSPSGEVGYSFLTVRTHKAYALPMEPGLFDDGLQTPWCEEVASCLLGDHNSGDDTAAESACFNGGPLPESTPTQTPSASPSPSPSDALSPSPTSTSGTSTQSPTEASPTEASPTESSTQSPTQ